MDLNQFIRENFQANTDEELATRLGISAKAVRGRRRRMGLSKSNPAPGMEGDLRSFSTKDTGITVFEKLLEENQIDMSQVGSVRISSWQQGQKGADGEAEVLNLGGAAITLKVDPVWQEGPEWPVVQPATPVTIKPASFSISKVSRKLRRAFLLPDPQIGYRRDLTTGELDPFHDEDAMSVALQIGQDFSPDLVINLGDFLDLPMFGRFAQEPGFQMTTQPTVDRGYRFLAEQQANMPGADYLLFEGNHDLRLQNFIIQNAIAAFGLKQAEAPEAWPVMSVQNLLRLDELGVKYVDGYPQGEYYINDRLRVEHGRKTAPRGKIASKIVDDERVSTITGHNHRIETVYKTTGVRGVPKINMGTTLGCLCLPLDTEILTDQGWKSHDEVRAGDKVLGDSGDTLEWTKVEDTVHYEESPLVRIQHSLLDVVCTPDHRWVVERRVGGRNTRHYERMIVPTTEICSEDRIVVSRPTGGAGDFISPQEAAMVGWLLTDGTIEKSGRGRIYQSPKKFTAEVESLLSAMGLPNVPYVSSRGLHQYNVPRSTVAYLWEMCGFGSWKPTQEELEHFVINLCPESRSALWEACFLAEGTTGTNIIAQKQGPVLEMFKLLSFLNGNNPREWKSAHDHIKKIGSCKGTVSAQKGRMNIVEAGSGPVWCVQTGLDTWVARQNGQIFLTGNCRIDGAVPSTKSAINAHGKPVLAYEDWQQAVGVVYYEEGDGPFKVDHILIHDGMAIFNDKIYTA